MIGLHVDIERVSTDPDPYEPYRISQAMRVGDLFPKIVELRGKWFSEPYPADTIIQVTALALPELEIEIEAVAVVRR